MKLQAHAVEKPWGRTDLDAIFGASPDRRVGEIWFTHPALEDPPLLAKYIFTSEKLSVQVHPDDKGARDRGIRSGKNECWYILNADRGTKLGLGLQSIVSKDDLRSAAIDGSIESLLDWRPVEAGDFFYVPAGTIHAIGAGIALLEIQQNSDVTYRLYDYGRPRELHLEDGIDVALRRPHAGVKLRETEAVNSVLLNEDAFSVVRADSIQGVPHSLQGRQRWVMPLAGVASSSGEEASAGECLLIPANAELSLSPGAKVIIAVAGRL